MNLSGNEENKNSRLGGRCYACDKRVPVYWCFECNKTQCDDCNSEHISLHVNHHVQHVHDKYFIDYTFRVKVSYISDIKLVNDELLCISDKSSSQLVTVNITDRKQRYISLPGDPLCITVVDNSTVAVTLDGHSKVLIVDIEQGQIKTKFNVEVMCSAIMYRNKELFVGGSDNTVKVLSMSGEITRIIPLQYKTAYICGSYDGSIYCIGGNKLYSVASEDKLLFTFNHLDIEAPSSISTDDTGNILVACYLSSNIISISPNGQEAQVIVKHISGTHPPKICYIGQSKSIVVGRNDIIDVYKLIDFN